MEGSEINLDLLEILKRHQDLDGPIPCDIFRWRDSKYKPRGYLRRIAASSGVSEIGFTGFSPSFQCLENETSISSKKIHRSEVLKLGALYRAGKVSATDLFIASMVWGNGGTGYGPYRTSVALNIPRNGAVPVSVIENVGRLAHTGDIEGAYETMTDALWRIGPAFGTKFLYFASPPEVNAPIFDGVVAGWKSDGLPWVSRPSTAWTWNWSTYDLYRTWCNQQFDMLRAHGHLDGISTFHSDGSLYVDVIESSIFAALNQ
jgi:hypothetical protein